MKFKAAPVIESTQAKAGRHGLWGKGRQFREHLYEQLPDGSWAPRAVTDRLVTIPMWIAVGGRRVEVAR